MDYALVHAVRHALNPDQQVITFYDINCQYSRNLAWRIQSNKFITLPDGLCILPGIGIWHVHGHKTECFARYAPNFIPGAGGAVYPLRLCGELPLHVHPCPCSTLTD